MHILVTGGTGFIGSHICSVLLRYNLSVTIFDSLINSSLGVVDRIKEINNQKLNNINFIKGDIRNINHIEKVFYDAQYKRYPINAVIHCAGLKVLKDSLQNPLNYWDVNVSGTLNLLKIMKKYSCYSIVFSSSATVYDNNGFNLLDEKKALKPINPYGHTKLTNENILSNLFHSSQKDWKIANLRYFNPIGAHESGLIGENPKGVPNNLFPYLSQVAMGKRNSLKVFGNDWPTKDGTCIRDFIHIMDLAEGHYAALEYLKNNKSNFININLGTGKGTSVLELINAFSNANNCKINYSFDKRRDYDLPFVVADNNFARKILNWEPTRGIEEMCRDGWNWQITNPNGFL